MLSCEIAGTNGDDADDKAKIPVVQQKGRFKVTSENVDLEKVALNLIPTHFSNYLDFKLHLCIFIDTLIHTPHTHTQTHIHKCV